MSTVTASSLNYRVAIQSKSASKDGFGQHVASWTTLDTLWASITPVSGKEDENGQIVSSATSKIVIRWNSSYSNIKSVAGYRITCEGRIFNIQAILLDRINGSITFQVVEGGNDG
ncbi:MAG: phage head closure protein [Magnetococcales bacterium]|nr:phage head closure protein [Magnetococcales bacterium]